MGLLLATVLIVSASGPYQSIADAFAAAQPGDTIVVRGGVHPPLVIDQSLTLIGEDGAVIDGGGVGDVVRIEAPDVTLEGFELRNSGRILDREHAGVTVEAARATVRNNVMHEVLFGVFLKHADGTVVEGNDIHGYEYDLARRGDGLRSWYSADATFAGNHVQGMRDVILWFSNSAHVLDNVVLDGRYGLHFMYDDDMTVRGNELAGNSVGAFIMYSSRVTVEQNLIRDNFGPSGYGIGLKEVDDVMVRDNVLLRNRIGVSFDTTPHQKAARAQLLGNLVAFNHVGLSFQPSTQRVESVGNWIDRNTSQIEVRGGGDLLGNTWTRETGNYWSDYVGYDANGDGVGDVAYEPRSLFGSLRDEHPALALFDDAPAALAIDFAARALPNLRPSAKVVDTAPLLEPGEPSWFEAAGGARWPFLVLGGALAAVAAVVVRGARPMGFAPVPADRVDAAAGTVGPVLAVRGLGKRYGARSVLRGVDLDLRAGEAVALWGGNGAGKTTALRSILGIVRHEGDVEVAGVSVRRQPRIARRAIGYVPQDLQLPDLPASELLEFFGALRGVAPAAARAQALTVGIEAHLDKRPAELSGGLRQRLALALALLGDPAVLLLDEPTANLDRATRDGNFRVLAKMRDDGIALLFTTHREDEVVALADRVITLRDGEVESEQDADEFARHVRSHITPLLIRVADEDVERAVEVLERAGITSLPRAGWIRVVHDAPAVPLRALWEAGIEVVDSAIGAER